MYEQMLENFRKAGEASMQMQQDLLRQWSSGSFGMPSATSWLDQKSKVQSEWAETMTDLVRKQKALVEARYEAGVKAMEDSFKLAKAKDPAEFKELAEAAFKRGLATAKELMESEIKQLQTSMERCWETASKAAS